MMIRPLPMADNASPITVDGMTPLHRFLSDYQLFVSLRRMLAQRQAKPLMTRIDFMQQITLYLPEVAALIEERDFGLLPQEVGALKRATQQALRRFDFPQVRRHLSLVGNLFEHGDGELRTALLTAYIEALFLDDHSPAHQEARDLLSRPLEEALRQAEMRKGILQRLRPGLT